MTRAPLALDLGKAFHPSAVIAPVLPSGKLVASVEMPEHLLMIVKASAATQERTFPPLLRGHLLTSVALHGGPYDEPVQGCTVIMWNVAVSGFENECLIASAGLYDGRWSYSHARLRLVMSFLRSDRRGGARSD